MNPWDDAEREKQARQRYQPRTQAAVRKYILSMGATCATCLATITFALSDNYPRDVTFKTFFLAQQPFTLVLRAVGTKRMSLFNPIYGDL